MSLSKSISIYRYFQWFMRKEASGGVLRDEIALKRTFGDQHAALWQGADSFALL